jgi:hypothetical protein
MYYRSAACNLAAEATKLAGLLTDGSADLIECQFAHVRASYAKCKGAHAALQAESPAAQGRKHMTEDLMAMI